MIPAAKNRWVEAWFRGYTRRYLRRSFHRAMLLGEIPEKPRGPVLICSNHSSWWDLLAAYWLGSDVLGWDGYAPMDERQLRRYGILRRLGIFGVDREHLRGSREFLDYSLSLLRERDRALWITAQGAMVSNDVRPVRLYSGIAHLARALGECQVMTVAIDYEFWDEKTPELFVALGPLMPITAGEDFSTRGFLEALEDRLELLMDELDHVRRQRDPSLFHVALSSHPATSPVYDTGRRLAAALKGESLDLRHGALLTPPPSGPAARR